jgi:diguanylate cyclase (GGDEF)-like protein/PAS domain S-box-containing protein
LKTDQNYKAIFNAIKCPIVIINADLRILECNSTAADLGIAVEANTGIEKVIPWAERDLRKFASSSKISMILNQKDTPNKDGVWYEISVNKMIGNDGDVTKMILIWSDISGIKITEEAIQQDLQLFSSIIEFLPDPTFVIDIHGKVIAWNRSIVDLTNIPANEMLGMGDYEYAVPFYGQRRPILIDYIMNKERQLALHYPDYHMEGDSVSTEVYLSSLRQEGIHLWAKATTLKNIKGEVIGAVETIRDITDLKKSEEQIQYLSTHDPVTGLFNKIYFETEIERLENSRRFPISVLFCDLRSLRKFNDDRKYPIDDLKVKEAGTILRACFRKEDLVARIGSLEFGVLMPTSELAIGNKAVQRVIQAVVKYNQTKTKSESLQLSIGLSTSSEPSTLRKAVNIAHARATESQA